MKIQLLPTHPTEALRGKCEEFLSGDPFSNSDLKHFQKKFLPNIFFSYEWNQVHYIIIKYKS